MAAVVFERFRAILHEGEINKRVQFIIEGLFAIRKAKFKVSYNHIKYFRCIALQVSLLAETLHRSLQRSHLGCTSLLSLQT